MILLYDELSMHIIVAVLVGLLTYIILYFRNKYTDNPNHKDQPVGYFKPIIAAVIAFLLFGSKTDFIIFYVDN